MRSHGIVYVSEATVNLSEPALVTLLKQARIEHHRADLTGLLLYCEGRFLQVMEGPETALREFFSRVAADPRHCKLQKLADGPKPHRDFADWHMSFACACPEQYRQFPQFLDLRQLQELVEPTPIAHILREFLAESHVPLH